MSSMKSLGLIFALTLGYIASASAHYLQSDPMGVAASLNTYAYVDSDPLMFIDPFGLAKCTYSISKRRMTCTSNNGAAQSSIGPEGVWSGVRQCQDNPSQECVKSKDLGPIPPGGYNMNRDYRAGHNGFWRLEPNPKIPGWKCSLGLARCGFMFHPGVMSLGCITVDKTDPDLMKQYLDVHDLLLKDEGSNSLTVQP
jgi:uncharacterized protein RhaS with RHS repeats